MLLILGIGSAVAEDSPFNSAVVKPAEQQVKNHPVLPLGLTVVGIMGTSGRILAVLKTGDGEYHIVSNGDSLWKEDVEIVRISWKGILVRYGGKIRKLNTPRTSFQGAVQPGT